MTKMLFNNMLIDLLSTINPRQYIFSLKKLHRTFSMMSKYSVCLAKYYNSCYPGFSMSLIPYLVYKGIVSP